MATLKEGKHKRKTTIEPNMGVSWQERKYLVDKEEETLKQDIEDLKIWVFVFGQFSITCSFFKNK